MNNKGDVFQLIFVLIILFIAAIVGLIFLTFSQKVTQVYQSTGLLNQSTTATNANQILQDSGPNATDYMIFFLFLGSNIGILISATRTQFSPTIMFMFILLLLITIFVAAGFVNIYQGFATSPALSDTASKLTFTNFIFSKYTPLIMTVLGGLIMIIMWGKSGSDIVA